MDLITLFSITGIVIFIGFIGEYIFERTNIPDVLWLMIVGFVIGHFVDVKQSAAFQEFSPIFITFALIFILFEGVLNVDLKKIFTGVVEGGSLSFVSFVLTMFFTSVAMMAAGWGFWEGLLLGAMLGDASQAVIVPLIKKIHIKEETSIALTFESAISDVFVLVGTLAIINIILLKSFSVTAVFQKITYSFLSAIAIGIIAGIIWVKLLPFMDKLSKSYLTSIAALLLLYSFVEYFGANGALACLTFGIILGNSKKIFHMLKKDTQYNMENSAKFFYSQISFFLKTFFFVYLGIIIDVKEYGLMIIGILLAILLFLVRPISVSISHRGTKLEDKERSFLEVLTPKGLSAAVAAQLPLQYGIARGEQFPTIVLFAIITSVLISIIGVFLTEKGYFKGIGKVLNLMPLFRKREQKVETN
jgi:potassium/hydrogen antiporter